MISQTVEYALRAVVALAQTAPKALTTEQVAKVTRVPPAYLSKVLQTLARAGIVHSQRGLHGGFHLAKTPQELTILEVVNCVEPIQRIRSCPLELKSHGVKLCALHARLDSALSQVEKAFADTTLAEVLAEPTTSVPLCEFPKLNESAAR
jgi:Rrf2 family transcriptional regulator, nitric oxide-sensitive transcriptional repressor